MTISAQHKQAMESYINAFNESNLDGVLALFSEQARIYSPTQAEPKTPGDFYPALLERSKGNTKFELKAVFGGENENTACMLFDYHKTMDQGTVTFDCVDVCSFDESGKIEEMRIIFNPKNLGL